MGLAFTPQTSTATATPEQNTDTPINPVDDFFDIEKALEPAVSSPTELSELPPAPELRSREIIPAQPNKLETKQETKVKAASRPTAIHPASLPQVDPVTTQIEKIMEEGIGEAYQELTQIQKQQFKIKGEETARSIKVLLQATKIKIKKIFDLIFEWLKLLPGVNRYFLMQEAKIKTDKILGLKNIHK